MNTFIYCPSTNVRVTNVQVQDSGFQQAANIAVEIPLPFACANTKSRTASTARQHCRCLCTFLWQPNVLLRRLLVMFSSKRQPDGLPLSESPSFPRFALIAAAEGCWRSSSDCSGGSLTSPTRKAKEIKQAGPAAWQNQRQLTQHTTEPARIFYYLCTDLLHSRNSMAHVPAKAVKGANIG